MIAASWPREAPLDERLLVVDPRAGTFRDGRVRDLARLLVPGDLLVVNDAATVPASLAATTKAGDAVEIRLAARLPGDGTPSSASPGGGAHTAWRAVLLGAGDRAVSAGPRLAIHDAWRTRTEHRPPPPAVRPGDVLSIAPGFDARVESLDGRLTRLLVLRFSLDDDAFWPALYAHGRPIQYAHVAGPLALWHVQTPFAARPWAVEMPSAGRPLAWSLLADLRARAVRVATLTHAAGLSATGDPGVDAALPLPERFDLPAATLDAIAETRARGRRVVAAGTTVVRALEGCALLHGGSLAPGEGTTDLRIDARFVPRVVDGLLTGLHELGTSHRSLVQAFAPEPLLARSWTHAEAAGYLDHEFGDECLVLPGALPA